MDTERPLQPTLPFDDDAPQFLLTGDEMFDAIDEQRLRRWKENWLFEKKSALTQPRSVGDYFSMWANTSPDGGLIVCGVTNDNVFEGCSKLGMERMNDLLKTGETFCPDAEYQVKRVPIARDVDGERDIVFVFRVFYHKTRVVSTTSGKVFIRRGDSLKELKSEEEIRSLKADKGEIAFELEPCNLEYPDQFDMSVVEDYADAVRSKKTWRAQHSTGEVLELMHLGKRKGKKFEPNLACALLFAKDPRLVLPGSRIRFLRFEGETQGAGTTWNAVKDEFIDGTIPQMLERISSVLRSQLRSFSRLDPSGKFYSSPEYPEFAWYEGLVNALAHRSYGDGMKNLPVFVKMYDNRLEINSPGSFAPFVTPDNIYEIHAPRNPYLMDAMYYLDYVKCANEGTRRMRQEMAQMDLPAPEFRQESTSGSIVKVTLKNGINQRKAWIDRDVAEVIGARLANLLTPHEKRCINFVAENGRINVNQAVRLTNVEWGTAKRILLKLTRQGILLHIHSGKTRDPKAVFVLAGADQP